jgi:hypothetical protein
MGGQMCLQTDEYEVINLVLAPRRVGPVCERVGGPVVHAAHVFEASRGQLRRLDPKLVLQLAPRGGEDADGFRLGGVARRVHLIWGLPVQRVRAAGVGPHPREGHLRRRPLLQQ